MLAAIDAIKSAIGADKVFTDDATLASRRYDRWCVNHLRDYRGETLPVSAAVVRPGSVADVQAIMRVCSATSTPVIPYGLGSGVCGGVVASPDAILLDMSGMNRVRSINPVNLLAEFDAGEDPPEETAITVNVYAVLAVKPVTE